jgi:hypothetical protein
MCHIFPNNTVWIGLVQMRSRRLMIRLVPYVAIFGLLASALAWQDFSSRRVAKPVDGRSQALVAEHDVPVAPEAASSAGGQVLAELAPRDVRPFSLVGVTWQAGMPADAEIGVRWRSAGQWSEWTDLHQELVPMEDAEGRPGTEPQWVGNADAVAVRITSATAAAKPVDLEVATVTPGKSADATPVAVAQPGIISRAQWGAAPQSGCSQPIYGSTTMGAIVHHTAGSNNYTAAESASIVKATQAYHMKSRSWCDIGYNFLIDKYGQIFEGRAGGIDRQVRAAHSGNAAVNELTMGVSLMGTFESVAPSEAMKTATVNLIAWRFDMYHVPATGAYALGGRTLQRIDAHRNVVSTACPGAQAFAWIGAPGGLRERVTAMVGLAAAPPAGPTGVYTAAANHKTVVLAWNPVAGAKRYRVRLAQNPAFSGPKVTKDSGKSLVRLSGLKRGRAYYAQVRAYKKNGKPFGPWSATVVTATLG